MWARSMDYAPFGHYQWSSSYAPVAQENSSSIANGVRSRQAVLLLRLAESPSDPPISRVAIAQHLIELLFHDLLA